LVEVLGQVAAFDVDLGDHGAVLSGVRFCVDLTLLKFAQHS
jgi:hypothetical protein